MKSNMTEQLQPQAEQPIEDKAGKPLLDHQRRRLLVGLGTVLGSATAAKLLEGNAIAVANAFEPRPGAHNTAAGKLLSASQMQTLRAVCQTIIPVTETLGAGDVDVQGFIDNQLFYCFRREQQKQVKRLLKKLGRQGFDTLKATEQQALLLSYDDKESSSKKTHESFRFLKSLVAFGYYTSEEGASKELKYLPFPGTFKGSVPYESIGRNFGSHAYY